MTNQFPDFIGISSQFDFFFQYKDFDFSNFDLSWLLDFHQDVLKKISKNKHVKKQIHDRIIYVLKTEKTAKHDEARITNVLITYFC